ncbi:MAG TPA: translocation/assembly module TamB domain-containing protein [Bacteroidales bacterium]|nr:translocation/assembly module TamB domain-containing protein [Bacteroidales bacterium]HRS99808.1 translocation/assembly module TamB domain-containing protein [Bacteroidales bacterium]
MLLYILAISPPIQSFLTKKIINFAAKYYEIDLTLDRVYLSFPDKLVLENIRINDTIGDTLLFVKEINLQISKIKVLDRKVHIDKFIFNEAFANVWIDSTGTANYEYILNKFSSETTDTTQATKPITIICNNFEFKNSSFKFRDVSGAKNNDLFDASNLLVNGINLRIENFRYQSDSILFSIKDFTLNENSGINIIKLSADFVFHPKGIELNNFLLKTFNSTLKCNQLAIEGSDESYLDDLINKSKFVLDIDTLIFDFADLSPFMPEYRHWHDKIHISGNFKGRLSKFRFNKFSLRYGENSRLSADLSIDGMPDIDLAFIFGNISKLQVSTTDLQRLLNTLNPKEPTILPQSVKDIENISFSGNLTGMLNDLVAYGSFNSSVGSINTDLSIKSDFESFFIRFKGKVRGTDIDLGRITGDPNTFSKINFITEIDGNTDSSGNYSTKIKADILNLGILGYNYNGIKVQSEISNDFYKGEILINDPNLQVELYGQFDDRGKSPVIDLKADLKANLSKINIVPDSLNSELRFNIYADIKGEIFTFPEGNVNLSDLYYSQNNNFIKAGNFSISSFIDETTSDQNLRVRSDFLDANFRGKFLFNEMFMAINDMLANYIPSFVKHEEHDVFKSENTLNFDITLKNTNQLTEIFLPHLSINKDIIGEGFFSVLDNKLNLVLSLPEIKYDSIYFWGSQIDLNTFEDSLSLILAIQEISTKTFPVFENFLLTISTQNDSINLRLLWNNNDTKRNNSGNIFLHTRIQLDENITSPNFYGALENSWFIVENRVWEIRRTPLKLTNNIFSIDKFMISHNNQSLSIDGEVGAESKNVLRFLINNVDVSNFNNYIEDIGFKFNGILSGNGRLSGVLGDPNFRASVSIADFKINEQDFGRFDISGAYTDDENGIRIEGSNKLMKLRTNYYPKKDSIDFNLNVNNLYLNMFEDFLSDLEISNVNGYMDLILTINGNIKDPEIQGFIKFEKTELTYDYLNLRLSTDDKITFSNNAIVFNNFKLFDVNKNPATVNGSILHNNFSNFRFDITAVFDNLKAMNTTEKDNDLFYGNVYASGSIRFRGDLDNYGIDVFGKTMPLTRFFLPMTSTYETSYVDFITFIQPSVDSSEINTSGNPTQGSKYYFKMDVEITPDAEVQIVFDPKVGDIIRGFAKGNLKMEYTSNEDFYMYGEVEILEGDYLFTLQNIINKRFRIQPGGTITWYGDPYEAILNLNAVYYTKAPLKELMTGFDIDSSEVYNRPTNIECYMKMTGNLMSPEIVFDIKIPNANEKVKSQLASMTQDEINKQMLFLLITNRFSQAMPGMDPTSQIGTTTTALGTTSSELLSNQISNWLSQISRDFDIGFKYNPGATDISGQEVELALSTQLLNDRILINGNMAYGEGRTHNNAFVGDIEIQLKVNRSGNFRIKGFSRKNDELEAEFGPYTSGVGVFYTKDFNTFGELIRDIIDKITFKEARTRRKKQSSEYY